MFMTDLALLLDDWKPHDDTDASIHLGYAEQTARIREGDETAFEELIFALSRSLESYARRFLPNADLAQDAVQDVFAHLWMQRESLRLRGSLRVYLYTAVRNRALDLRKSSQAEIRRLSNSPDADVPLGMGQPLDTPDVMLQRDEVEVRVYAALDSLPPRTREAALLRWRDGLSRGEIATIMGVATPTVNNQLTAAARVVRALLIDLREST